MPVEFVESFEDLLKSKKGKHGFEDLVTSFEDLLEDLNPPPVELVKSFEDLLRTTLWELLLSFNSLLSTRFVKPPKNFLKSLEDLLESFEDLLLSFEKIVKKSYPKNKDLIESFEVLIAEFEVLIIDWQELYNRLDDVPDEILLSDIVLSYGLTNLQQSDAELLSGLKNFSSNHIEKFVDSLITGEKVLFRLADNLSRQKPINTALLKKIRRLIPRRKKVIANANQLLKKISRPSVFLLDGMEDLNWLHERLGQRLKELNK